MQFYYFSRKKRIKLFFNYYNLYLWINFGHTVYCVILFHLFFAVTILILLSFSSCLTVYYIVLLSFSVFALSSPFSFFFYFHLFFTGFSLPFYPLVDVGRFFADPQSLVSLIFSRLVFNFLAPTRFFFFFFLFF